MRVIAAQDQTLTNVEALQHIENVQARFKAQGREKTIPKHLEIILNETRHQLAHQKGPLNPGPTSKLLRARTDDEFAENVCFEQLKEEFQKIGVELMWKRELLMIINVRPTNRTVLGVILEDGDERFGEEKVDEMVEIIKRVLGTGREELQNGHGENGQMDVEEGAEQ